jgi:hypothetical protein
MPRQLLSEFLEQAEQSEPVVRAALFHIARVLKAFDHADVDGQLTPTLRGPEAESPKPKATSGVDGTDAPA